MRNNFLAKPSGATNFVWNFLAIFVVIILLNASVTFAVPNQISLHGKLTNLAGSPQTGNFNFTFKIYDASSGGNELWQQINKTITLGSDGVYDVILPATNVSYADQYFLGIAVAGGAESTPRVNLTSAPYAYRANVSEGLNPNNPYAVTNISIAGNTTIGTGPTTTLTISTQGLNLTRLGALNISGELGVGGSGNSFVMGSLGIGVIAPATKLEVKSGTISGGSYASPGETLIRINADVMNTDDVVRLLDFYDDDAGADFGHLSVKAIYSPVGNNELALMTGSATSNIVFGINDVEKVRISSSGKLIAGALNGSSLNISGPTNLAYATGNVGIGQTSPNVTLGVSGAANITGRLSVGNGLNVTGGLSVTQLNDANCDLKADASGNFYCGTDSGASNLWNSSGANVYLNDTTANVGIGIILPRNRLSILVDEIIASPQSALHINLTDNYNTSVINAITLDHVLKSPMNATNGVGVSILFRATDNVSQISKLGNISAFFYNATNGSQLSALTFSTRGPDTGDGSFGHLDERLRIDGVGNVGINITNPKYALHVGGIANITGNLLVSGAIYGTLGAGNITGTLTDAQVTNDLTIQTTNDLTVGGGYSAGGVTLYATGGDKGSGFFANDILLDGEVIAINDIEINESFIPVRDNFEKLGNHTNRFSDGYVVNIRSGNVTLTANTNLTIIGNLTVDGTTLVVDEVNNRVGIGTGSPNDALEVTGNVRISGSLNASEINATKLRINNTLFVNGSRVGIGTTGPAASLHILSPNTADNDYGDVTVENNGTNWALFQLGSFSNTSGHSSQLILRRAHGNPLNPGIVRDGDQIGGVYMRAYDGSSYRQRAGISTYIDGLVTGATIPLDLIFYAGSTGATERMRIKSNGNVGIGTNNATANLEVVGDVIISGNLNATKINATSSLQYPIKAIRSTTVTDAPRSAIAALHKTSGDMADGFAVNVDWNIQDDTSAETTVARIAGVRDGADNTGRMDLRLNNAGTDTLIATLKASGNVGIGNSNPNATLHVTGTANITGYLEVGSGLNVSNGLTVLSGNVGVGTANPSSKLQVMGDITITNGSLWQPIYPQSDGLKLYFPFSEGGGSIVYDNSGYGEYDGAITNALRAEGKYGRALYFDSSDNNDYVQTASTYVVTPNLTVSAWIKTTNATRIDIVNLGGSWSSDNIDWNLEISSSSSGKATFNVYRFTVSGGRQTTSSTSVNDGQWHHIVATLVEMANASNISSLYIDGILEATRYDNVGFVANTKQITVGGRPGADDYFFNGTIDEVKIYERALSSDEVRAEYLAGLRSNGILTANKLRIINTSGNKIFELNQTGFAVYTSGSERLKIDSSGNVGIGTSSPNAKLVVDGGVNITGGLNVTQRTHIVGTDGRVSTFPSGVGAKDFLVIENNNNVNINLVGTTTNTAELKFTADGSSNKNGSIVYGFNGNYMAFYTATSERVRIDSDGKVGINTTSPAHTLTVLGTLNVTGQPTRSGDLFVASSGNVGIGTTSPSEKLTVIGNAEIIGNLTIQNGSLWQPVYGSDDGLLLYLPFENLNSSVQYDRSPFGNDGYIVRDVRCGSNYGKYGAGCLITHNSTDGYIQAPYVEVQKNGTVEAWIKSQGKSAAGRQYIVSIGSNSVWYSAYEFAYDDINNYLNFWFGDTKSFTTSSNSVVRDEWYHVAVTWDNSSGMSRMYINGDIAATSTAPTDASFSAQTTYIGVRPERTEGFNGTIDELKIYNRALAPEEIRSHYLRGSNFNSMGAITANRFRVVNSSGIRTLEINNTAFAVHTAGEERLMIDSSGSVGINTSSPTYLLDMWSAGIVNAPLFRIKLGGTEAFKIKTNSDSAPYLQMQNNLGQSKIVLNTTGYSYFNGGNLGIGTEVPGRTLEVSGSINGTQLNISGQVGLAYGAGKVGIGTNSPTQKLYVNGNATVNGSLYMPIYPSNDGLALYLPFDIDRNITTSNVVYDYSPYGNDGYCKGVSSGCNQTGGKYGNAIKLDGVNDYVNVSGISSLSFMNGENFTVEFWVNFLNWSATSNIQFLYVNTEPDQTSTGNAGATGYDMIYRGDSSGNTQIRVKDSTGTGVTGTITTNIGDGNWHHVVATHGWGGVVQGYVDGEPSGTGTAMSLTGHINVSGSLILGHPQTIDGYRLNGTMDEFRVYRRLLMPEEIRTHYLRGVGGVGASSAIKADRFRVINTSGYKIFEVNQTGAAILPTKSVNVTIGTMEIAAFNSSCTGFRHGTTGGWVLSCE